MLLLKGFCLAAFLIQLSHCHSTGAGVEACVNMLPDHGFPAQTTPPPYTITPSVTTVAPGQTVTITIARTSVPHVVRGFMIQGRNPAGTAVGTFFLTTGMTLLACPGFTPASVATHSSPDLRESIAIVWTAPATPGPVVFHVTVVDNLTTYWPSITTAPVTVG